MTERVITVGIGQVLLASATKRWESIYPDISECDYNVGHIKFGEIYM